MQSLSSVILISGAALLAASLALAISQAPLGSPLFYASAAVMAAAYLFTLRRVWAEPPPSRRWLAIAFLIAVAVRIPLAAPRVGHDNDMMRYVWDGRVQTLGYNPFAVTPADPALAATHNDETREMPSRRARTPYPPGAQLFFRLVVSLRDSARAMKIALVLCDLMTMIVLWRWLVVTGRNEWLTLAYAWNPLVVLEIAHSGHIDALGALWITASAYWLARKRTSLSVVAFVLAVTTKLLPVVLIPLYPGTGQGPGRAPGLRAAGPALPAVQFRRDASPGRRAERSGVHSLQWAAVPGPAAPGLAAVRGGGRGGGGVPRRGLGAVALARGRAGRVGLADGGGPGGIPGHLSLVLLYSRRSCSPS